MANKIPIIHYTGVRDTYVFGMATSIPLAQHKDSTPK